jgi:cysteinyl-tRNA synthetase
VAGTVMFLGRLLGLFHEKPPKAEESLGGELTARLVGLLIDVRNKARKAKQFEIGDHVRNELAKMGVRLEDRPDGTVWRME